MNLQGEARLRDPPPAVFHSLFDPSVLERCIPGCEDLQKVDDAHAGVHSYRATVKVGVGAIKGRFMADVTVSEIRPPESYVLSLKARSPAGHVQGEAHVRLAEDGGTTRLHWDADAKVSGMMAAVGQRLLGAAAQRFADDFFRRLAEVIDA